MANNNLRTEDLDLLGQALITLAQELWILKDRQRVLEAALTDAGVLGPDAVDNYQPDPELGNKLDTERQRFIDGIIKSLVHPPATAAE